MGVCATGLFLMNVRGAGTFSRACVGCPVVCCTWRGARAGVCSRGGDVHCVSKSLPCKVRATPSRSPSLPAPSHTSGTRLNVPPTHTLLHTYNLTPSHHILDRHGNHLPMPQLHHADFPQHVLEVAL